MSPSALHVWHTGEHLYYYHSICRTYLRRAVNAKVQQQNEAWSPGALAQTRGCVIFSSSNWDSPGYSSVKLNAQFSVCLTEYIHSKNEAFLLPKLPRCINSTVMHPPPHTHTPRCSWTRSDPSIPSSFFEPLLYPATQHLNNSFQSV